MFLGYPQQWVPGWQQLVLRLMLSQLGEQAVSCCCASWGSQASSAASTDSLAVDSDPATSLTHSLTQCERWVLQRVIAAADITSSDVEIVKLEGRNKEEEWGNTRVTR